LITTYYVFHITINSIAASHSQRITQRESMSWPVDTSPAGTAVRVYHSIIQCAFIYGFSEKDLFIGYFSRIARNGTMPNESRILEIGSYGLARRGRLKDLFFTLAYIVDMTFQSLSEGSLNSVVSHTTSYLIPKYP